MKIFKKLVVGISLGLVGFTALNLGSPKTYVNAKVITQFNEEKKQKFNKCRVYDPNRMNYKNSIREYANKYVSLGYMVFDLKSLNKEIALSSVPYINKRNLTDDGIFCFDSFEHPTFDIIVSKMSRTDYETAYLNRKITNLAQDCSITRYDSQNKVCLQVSYDPIDEVVVVTHPRNDGWPID